MGLSKEGFSGIISPVVTPFDEGEDIDFDAFRSEVRYILGFGVSE